MEERPVHENYLITAGAKLVPRQIFAKARRTFMPIVTTAFNYVFTQQAS